MLFYYELKIVALEVIMKYYRWQCLNMFFFSFFVFIQGNNTTSFPSGQPSYAPQFNVSINNSNGQLYPASKNTVSCLFDYVRSFDPQPYKQYVGQWLKKNKYKIIQYGICSWYVGTWLLLLSSHYYFNQTDLWSDWQLTIPFTELCARSEQLLQQELIFDIQRRYINQQNPTDFISPFVTFLSRINSEEKYINRYITLLNGINSLRLAQLFLITEKKVKEIKLRKQRLTFVRELFLSWIAEYNINQGKAKQPA